MHDYDRIQAEYESLIPELGADPHEFSGEGELSGEWEWEGEGEGEAGRRHGDSPFSESQEMELAAELLDVRNEQELDHFLGNLISKVGGALKSVVKGPIGQALGGVLKKVAKTVLPIAGSALGTFIGGPAGGARRQAGVGGREHVRPGARGPERRGQGVRGGAAVRPVRRLGGEACRQDSARCPPAAGGPLGDRGRRGGTPPASCAGWVAPEPGRPTPAHRAATVTATARMMGSTTADDQGADGADADSYGDGDPGGMVPAGARRRGTWIRRGRRIILFGV